MRRTGPVRTRWRQFRRYWQWLFRSFRAQAAGHWPILGAVLLYPFVSSAFLCAAECQRGYSIENYPEAVYMTW
ncbi:MAG: hypothetical protein ACYC1C_06250, partial [Chloroflexota bacterium]